MRLIQSSHGNSHPAGKETHDRDGLTSGQAAPTRISSRLRWLQLLGSTDAGERAGACFFALSALYVYGVLSLTDASSRAGTVRLARCSTGFVTAFFLHLHHTETARIVCFTTTGDPAGHVDPNNEPAVRSTRPATPGYWMRARRRSQLAVYHVPWLAVYHDAILLAPTDFLVTVIAQAMPIARVISGILRKSQWLFGRLACPVARRRLLLLITASPIPFRLPADIARKLNPGINCMSNFGLRNTTVTMPLSRSEQACRHSVAASV